MKLEYAIKLTEYAIQEKLRQMKIKFEIIEVLEIEEIEFTTILILERF